VFHSLARTLCTIASLGQAILVGRGGFAITRKIPDGIHVRLIASIEWRIENLRGYPGRAHEANTRFVKQADRERESFVGKYLGVDPGDPGLYHLVLNNEMLTVDEQAELIAGLVVGRYGDQP
jgi:cytidylate kinase